MMSLTVKGVSIDLLTFRFLSSQLTHGLMMKEIARIKNEELLECNDSVKVKVKEYIRGYMKKFGPYYVRS